MTNTSDDAIPNPFDWKAGGMINPDTAPEQLWAGIAALAQLQLLDRIIELENNEDRKNRMQQARKHFAERIGEVANVDKSTDMFSGEISTEPDTLIEQIHKKLPEAMCLGMLIAAEIKNPFDPFSFKISEPQFSAALQQFARDLGVPADWAVKAHESVDASSPNAIRGKWKGWALAIGGALIAIASVPLVFVFAPAGLAGGAVFLSGLAALGGTTGMMGGLSIVAGVAVVGGTTATAGVFLTGTAAQVEARVKVLHANAYAKLMLRPATAAPEIAVLKAMLNELKEKLHLHTQIDDGRSTSAIKDTKKKIAATEAALKSLDRLIETLKTK